MERFAYIYALEYPEGNIRYIGKTVNLRKRYHRHINDARKYTSSHRLAWIRSILNHNDIPYISIVDKVPLKDWQYWERYYIQYYREQGYNLVNTTDGGDGNQNPSEEIRSKISEGLKEYYIDNSPWNKGLKGVSTGYPKGRKRSEADRQANSERKKQYFAIHSVWNKDKCTLLEPEQNYVGRTDLKTRHIYQCDLNGVVLKEWRSVSVACHSLGFRRGGIADCLHKGRNSAYGFIWKYVD